MITHTQATMLRKSKMKRRNTEPVLTASMDRPGLPPDKASISEKPEGPEWWIIEAEGEQNTTVTSPSSLHHETKQIIRRDRYIIYTPEIWRCLRIHWHTHETQTQQTPILPFYKCSMQSTRGFHLFPNENSSSFTGRQQRFREHRHLWLRYFVFPSHMAFYRNSFSHSWY